jgi:hypothetical protein
MKGPIMSVDVTLQEVCTVIETPPTSNSPDLSAADNTVTHSGFNSTATLGATTTPPATLTASFVVTMTAGAADIDLTALPGLNGGTIDGTGLKVQVFRVRAKAANANPVAIEAGDSNGYDMFGANWKLSLAAGQRALLFGNDATPDVASGDKIIKVSGTGAQQIEVQVVLG